MAETSSRNPEERPVSPTGETARALSREEAIGADDPSRFEHGRFEPGQRLGTRYRVVGKLGEGGMGEVYRADDLELGQSVALKFIPQRVAADPAWLRRFRNEVRTARQIAHPNVCRIYDIGEVDGQVFLTMEYIDGEDLGGVLRRLGRPSREKAIEIARQICLGLAAAHENKVVHRDLKPANIMIDGRGRVRITDFGLAGFIDEFEGGEARAGTPAYMAPEQLAHGKVSVRSDIYSLGLILHELFTGKIVFDTNDVEELKRKHDSGSVSRSSSISDEIDPAVDRVLARCLEQSPEERPSSVYQVLAALPGGDPLAAALAAGELPSPELVANARDAGGLPVVATLALVVATCAAVAVMYVLSSNAVVMPDRAPARLSVVAEQVMEELGYGPLPRHSVSGYDGNVELYQSLRRNPRTFGELQHLEWPPRYRYWRRWSDGDFVPSDSHFPEQMMIDAPTGRPGSALTVALDSTGRLLALAVPSGVVEPTAGPTEEIDWSPLFKRAGLDPEDATQVEPEAAPSVFCDTVTAWRFDRPFDGGGPVTVLMGASRGRPTYFEFVGLHMQPSHALFELGVGPSEVAWALFNLFMIVLAFRNLRAGRVDHRSAFRCALFVGGLYAILEVVAITVGGSDPVGRVLALTNGRAVGHVLQHGIEGWIYYLAIEPYVRRVWPRMLIGLLRVFSGRWRDPTIGREVLIGLATSCVLMVVLRLVVAADWQMTADGSARLANPFALRSILSPAHYLSAMAHFVAWAVLEGVSCAGVVVLIRLLVRQATASVVLSVVVIAALHFGLYLVLAGDSMWALFAHALGLGACLVWLLTRVGVLSAMVFTFVMLSMGLFTIAFDAWSTPYLISWLATLLALAGYGSWVALAGQPIFKDMLAEPQPAS